jgi:cyclic lactone autoinducer peptide
MENKKPLLNLAKTLANTMITQDTYGWPPECIFITYQPERPVKQVEEDSEE